MEGFRAANRVLIADRYSRIAILYRYRTYPVTVAVAAGRLALNAVAAYLVVASVVLCNEGGI